MRQPPELPGDGRVSRVALKPTLLDSLGGSDGSRTECGKCHGRDEGRSVEKGVEIFPGVPCLGRFYPLQDVRPRPDRRAFALLIGAELILRIAHNGCYDLLRLVVSVSAGCRGGDEDGVVAGDGVSDPADEIEQDRGVAAQDERRVGPPHIRDGGVVGKIEAGVKGVAWGKLLFIEHEGSIVDRLSGARIRTKVEAVLHWVCCARDSVGRIGWAVACVGDVDRDRGVNVESKVLRSKGVAAREGERIVGMTDGARGALADVGLRGLR